MLIPTISAVQVEVIPYARIADWFNEGVAEMYWTPGWGNLLTVTVTAFGVILTNAVAGSRFKFDKEESRREAQRGPVAEAIEALLKFHTEVDDCILETATLELIPPTSPDWETRRDDIFKQFDALSEHNTVASIALRKSELSVVDHDVTLRLQVLRRNMMRVTYSIARYRPVARNPHLHPGPKLPKKLERGREQMEEAASELYEAIEELITIASRRLRPQADTKTRPSDH